MKHLGLAFVSAAALLSAPIYAFADTASDGSTGANLNAGRAIAGQKALYRLPDACSSAGTNNCGTVIQVNNLSTTPCNVGVEFRFGFDGSLACTVTTANVAPKTQTTLCSRTTPNPETCNSTCSPDASMSGFAIVYSSCRNVGVQATILTWDGSNVFTSARDVNLVYLGSPTALPKTKANRGD